MWLIWIKTMYLWHLLNSINAFYNNSRFFKFEQDVLIIVSCIDLESDHLAAPYSDEIKEGQWLGVSVRSQGPGKKAAVCAHRWELFTKLLLLRKLYYSKLISRTRYSHHGQNANLSISFTHLLRIEACLIWKHLYKV